MGNVSRSMAHISDTIFRTLRAIATALIWSPLREAQQKTEHPNQLYAVDIKLKAANSPSILLLDVDGFSPQNPTLTHVLE